MASYQAIRTAIGDKLRAIPERYGLRVFDYLPDSIPVGVAAAIIGPPTGDGTTAVQFDVAGDGVHLWFVTVRIFVGRVNERAAQDRLDAFLSTGVASSVRDALATGAPPGVGNSDINIFTAGNYGQVKLTDGQEYFVLDFPCQVKN